MTFMELRPDELIGWTPDGTPMPTPREQGGLLLEELERCRDTARSAAIFGAE